MSISIPELQESILLEKEREDIRLERTQICRVTTYEVTSLVKEISGLFADAEHLLERFERHDPTCPTMPDVTAEQKCKMLLGGFKGDSIKMKVFNTEHRQMRMHFFIWDMIQRLEIAIGGYAEQVVRLESAAWGQEVVNYT